VPVGFDRVPPTAPVTTANAGNAGTADRRGNVRHATGDGQNSTLMKAPTSLKPTRW
jgi:hypothetical protein